MPQMTRVLLISRELYWFEKIRRLFPAIHPVSETILERVDPLELEHYLIEEKIIDLVILDSSLEEELSSMLRQIRKSCPDAWVVVMTTAPSWRSARAAFRFGANDYLTKVYDDNLLVKTLHQILLSTHQLASNTSNQ